MLSLNRSHQRSLDCRLLRFGILVALIIVIGPLASLFLGEFICQQAACSPLFEGLAIAGCYIVISYVAFALYRRMGRSASSATADVRHQG